MVLSYSYAARRTLGYARSKGFRTVLLQIDPGDSEWVAVRSEYREHKSASAFEDAEEPPTSYWSSWKEELVNSDIVLCNSRWSRDLLSVSPCLDGQQSKLMVFPLDKNVVRKVQIRPYQNQEPDLDGRIRAIFVGAFIRRKGASVIVDFLEEYPERDVEITVYGSARLAIRERLVKDARIRFAGYVSWADLQVAMCDSDVLLFPTLSDGFGIVQLEALSLGLPGIVSRNCASVFQHMVTGYVVSEVNPTTLAAAFDFVEQRGVLDAMGKACGNAYESITADLSASRLEVLRSLI